MKVAYVTIYDSTDVQSWSGSGYHIRRALEDAGLEILGIGDLETVTSLQSRLKRLVYSKLLRKRYLESRAPELLKGYAEQVERQLAYRDADIVFSPGTVPIAYLRTDKPIVFWTDATFAGMVDFYPGFSRLSSEAVKNGNEIEQSALSRCELAIFSSDWAADTARQHYHVDPAKVHVVPFGANIDCSRNPDDIEKIIAGKDRDTCRLLFLGVDWHRKGGDRAVAVADELHRRGAPIELHIAGCAAPDGLPGYVVQHGFISKETPEGRAYLDRLMLESHFLILPTRADCCPVVFAEACSFGLPSLTTRVGGVPTAIRDGVNGRTFPPDEGIEVWCDYIQSMMASEQEYRELGRAAFREYSTRMNWATAGARVRDLLQQIPSR